MQRKWSAALAVLVVALLPVTVAAQPDAQTPPTVLLRVQSFDAVVQNVKILSKAVGQESMGKQLESLIKAQAGADGLDGIDTGKPWAVYVRVGEDITSTSFAVMVPIKQEKAFLKLLSNVKYEAKKKENSDIYIVAQNDIPAEVGFRFVNGYAYITAFNLDVLSKEGNLLTPAQVFPKGINATLSGALRMEQIPKAFKDIAISKLDEELKKLKDKAEAEAKTPAQKKFAVQTIDTFGEHVVHFLNGATEVAGQFNVDPMTKQLVFELTVDGKKNSQLMANIAGLAKNQSQFGGLVKQQAEAVQQLHVVLPDDVKKAFNQVVEEAITQGLKDEPDAKKKEFAQKFFEAVKPTLQSGELDTASSTKIHKDGTITMVAGVKVKQGAKLEQTLRDLHKELPPGEQAKLKLDVDKAGGASIHQVNIQDTLSPKDKKVLGDGPVYVGIRADALFIGVGKDALGALKQAAADSGTKSSKTVHVELKLGPILELVLQKDHEKAAVQKAFAKDSGLLRISVEGGQQLQMKMTANISLLEFAVAVSQKVKEVKFQQGE